MGLLGMIAAGGAMGARDASNANVQAQNQLEMEQMRESLREHYATKKYKRERADALSDRAASMEYNDKIYQRDRADTLADTESNRGFQLGILDRTESGKDRRFNVKMGMEREKLAAGKSSGASANGIVLPDGSSFVPNDADSKAAVNLVKLGLADDVQDAYQKIYASKYSSQAAGSIGGLRNGIIDESLNMSGQLLNRSKKQPIEDVSGNILKYNPKTGRLE